MRWAAWSVVCLLVAVGCGSWKDTGVFEPSSYDFEMTRTEQVPYGELLEARWTEDERGIRGRLLAQPVCRPLEIGRVDVAGESKQHYDAGPSMLLALGGSVVAGLVGSVLTIAALADDDMPTAVALVAGPVGIGGGVGFYYTWRDLGKLDEVRGVEQRRTAKEAYKWAGPPEPCGDAEPKASGSPVTVVVAVRPRGGGKPYAVSEPIAPDDSGALHVPAALLSSAEVAVTACDFDAELALVARVDGTLATWSEGSQLGAENEGMGATKARWRGGLPRASAHIDPGVSDSDRKELYEILERTREARSARQPLGEVLRGPEPTTWVDEERSWTRPIVGAVDPDRRAIRSLRERLERSDAFTREAKNCIAGAMTACRAGEGSDQCRKAARWADERRLRRTFRRLGRKLQARERRLRAREKKDRARDRRARDRRDRARDRKRRARARKGRGSAARSRAGADDGIRKLTCDSSARAEVCAEYTLPAEDYEVFKKKCKASGANITEGRFTCPPGPSCIRRDEDTRAQFYDYGRSASAVKADCKPPGKYVSN